MEACITLRQKGPGLIMNIDKNKQYMIEAIVGMVVLITLIIFAIWLLVRKGDGGRIHDGADETAAVEESVTEESPDGEMTAATPAGNDNSVTDMTQEKKGVDLTELERERKLKGTGELPAVYTKGEPLQWTKDDYQLPEIYTCWDNYELEAVTDLINLERVRVITDSLKNSNDFYYYGEMDASGNPDGKGLAVYADNTYYFGQWSNGLRSGEGMWVRIFPDKTGTVNGITGVTWHQYAGRWSNDYPNGQGQENIQYETEEMNVGNDVYPVQNAIGGFKDGFYNGEMYIMTNNGYGSTTDWYGTAKDGAFTYLNEKKGYNGKRAIWKAGDGYETGEQDNCRWILPAENVDYGIAGLKKG